MKFVGNFIQDLFKKYIIDYSLTREGGGGGIEEGICPIALICVICLISSKCNGSESTQRS